MRGCGTARLEKAVARALQPAQTRPQYDVPFSVTVSLGL